jgi:hypothetical protein
MATVKLKWNANSGFMMNREISNLAMVEAKTIIEARQPLSWLDTQPYIKSGVKECGCL